MKHIKIKDYVRVTKTQAKKYYNSGRVILIAKRDMTFYNQYHYNQYLRYGTFDHVLKHFYEYAYLTKSDYPYYFVKLNTEPADNPEERKSQ